ncbi:aminotransferase class V-fold PLP-dependent enzyme [Kitasatospora sp. NPDC094016]|uniref:pyridoxal phosphate-dependent decarboxylase family protein n=1 Tax=Kitasatospora sp. NPDC094016 TaxID=3154986 RepID=UPI003323806B
MDLKYWLGRAVDEIGAWAADHDGFSPHASASVTDHEMADGFGELVRRLSSSYPFFHPRYAGQMLKPPHPAAVAGYVAAMLINPNNRALDGGAATSALEEEAVAAIASMFGMPRHLGHLTGGGTVANLEALFVARETHPGKGIAYSREGHYTHARMCHLLGMRGYPIEVDSLGRMDPEALERQLAQGTVGTVVATVGTTGLGAVDPVHTILAAARARDVRVHVDAAYGGFHVLLDQEDADLLPDPRPWRAIAHCDSVVVDPHKHGLQPYGCGAVLFGDPGVGRFYRHDSPCASYASYPTDRPHLGEISLECSRSGAAAAALWLTQKLLPLTSGGLGQVLAAGRRAALRWAALIEESSVLDLYQPPDLDIVTYFPRTDPLLLSEVEAASRTVMRRGMSDRADPVYLSTARIDARSFAARWPGAVTDLGHTRILRSVLMKPESELHLDQLHSLVERLATTARHAG